MSHDLEDISATIDGRPEVIGEIERSSAAVRTYVAAEIDQLLNNRTFTESLPGFLNPDSARRVIQWTGGDGSSPTNPAPPEPFGAMPPR